MESLTGKTDPQGFSKIGEMVQQAAPLIFDFSFPFYSTDAQDKLEFEQQFLLHYYTREIGLETYGFWKLRLQSKLLDVMPKYTKLYEIEQKKYNIYDTVSMERTTDSTSTSGGTNNSKQTNESSRQTDDQYSDTPQGGLQGVRNGEYLTDYRYTDDNNNSTTTNTATTANNSSGQQTEKWTGKESGLTYAEMKMKERQSIININLMLIDEFEQLFMGVF